MVCLFCQGAHKHKSTQQQASKWMCKLGYGVTLYFQIFQWLAIDNSVISFTNDSTLRFAIYPLLFSNTISYLLFLKGDHSVIGVTLTIHKSLLTKAESLAMYM